MASNSPAALTISRRSTLGLALVAAFGSRFGGSPRMVAAQDGATWNYQGNAGHTGELPGPGLDVNGALGELWRIPRDEFFSDDYRNGVAGYANGVVYTRNGDSLWARRLSDGAFLWAQNPTTITATPVPGLTSATVEFGSNIAIDNGLVIVPVSDGGTWALDATTGEFRWNADWRRTESFVPPTIVDHVAYDVVAGGVIAIQLGDAPELRWNIEVLDSISICGIGDGVVFVLCGDGYGFVTYIRALRLEDGAEFWRTSPQDNGPIRDVVGVQGGSIAVVTWDVDTQDPNWLALIDSTGATTWRQSHYEYLYYTNWFVQDVIIRATNKSDAALTIQALRVENGQEAWRLDAQYGGGFSGVSDPIACAGVAYANGDYSSGDVSILLVVDLVNTKVYGAPGVNVRPLFVADGVLLGADGDTDEIVAIGTVPAVIQAGGRASVANDATLRGAPNDAAIEREQVAAGSVVNVTGDSETSNGVAWVPVTVQTTGTSGWLPADALAGLDGTIALEPIDLFNFGQFTVNPKFTYQTQAEVIEQVELRGAPSDTSATKATLEVGTRVTVTSPPTVDGDVEWCPIKVDDTGESGWVPASVLKLAPPA